MRVRDGASVVRAYIQQAESWKPLDGELQVNGAWMALKPANAETGCA
jgi:hypothetical protein